MSPKKKQTPRPRGDPEASLFLFHSTSPVLARDSFHLCRHEQQHSVPTDRREQTGDRRPIWVGCRQGRPPLHLLHTRHCGHRRRDRDGCRLPEELWSPRLLCLLLLRSRKHPRLAFAFLSISSLPKSLV